VAKAKILAWDIETTDLSASWGWVISAAWCDLNDPKRKISVLRIDDYKGYNQDRTNDKAILIDLSNALAEADIWFTWYGDRFDIPFTNTRLLVNGLNTLPTIPSVDGWKAARNHLKLFSNRLANVAELFGADRKTPVLGKQWQLARAGHREGIDYVVEHNIKDIKVLADIYDIIRPVIHNHPNVNLVEKPTNVKAANQQCPVCGSHRVHSRGYRVAKSRRSIRYQCQECGSWYQGPPERVTLKSKKKN